MVRQLDHLDDAAVRGDAGEHHAVGGQGVAVIVVDFISVAVSLMNGFCAVERVGLGSFVQDTWIGAQP